MRHRDRQLRGAFGGATKQSGAGGCLALAILLPALALTAAGVAVAALFSGAGRTRQRPDPVLEDLVRKLALDDTFTRDDADTAGVPVDEKRSVEELLEEGVTRGWIERHGDRYAVTVAARKLRP